MATQRRAALLDRGTGTLHKAGGDNHLVAACGHGPIAHVTAGPVDLLATQAGQWCRRCFPDTPAA